MGGLTGIYLDMDGVLVDFTSHVYEELYGVDDLQTADDLTDHWDAMPHVLTKMLGRVVTDEEMWDRIDEAGDEFWATIPWLPWGEELYSLCCAVAPVTLMSTPTRHPSSAAGKMKWINERMPYGTTRRYSLTPVKHHMAHPGALLIDDNEKNATLFSRHGGMAYLFPRRWNSAPHNPSDPLGGIRRLFQALQVVDDLLYTES